MKRIGYLYDEILNKDRIKQIIKLASIGKTKRGEVVRVLDNIDYYTDKIYEMLANDNYYMLPYHNKTIMEKGKLRELTISPFYPNRILDYIIVETLKPHIRKGMYEYCVGNVDKRGMVYGKKVIAKKYHKYKYYIKLDIHKFYPSVNSNDLFTFIESKIKDKRFLQLVKCVITQTEDLPIGSYYSQWFSNWYLQDLDHYIKERLDAPFYIRYVDDMLIMSNNKRQLINIMNGIDEFLKTKGLSLKRKEQVRLTSHQPIDYLGFRFTERRIVLRYINFKRLNKRLKKIRKTKHISVKQARGLISYIGWLKQIKCGYQYYINKIKPIIKLGTLKKIISNYDKNKLYLPTQPI